MSISLRSNPDGSGTLLNGATPVMEITAAGVVSLPNIAAGSSANQPVNLGQFIGTNVSLSANGYQKLPSGLIIQWGDIVLTTNGGGGGVINYPIAFPNNVFTVMVSGGDNTTVAPFVRINSQMSLIGCGIQTTNASASVRVTFIAIGR